MFMELFVVLSPRLRFDLLRYDSGEHTAVQLSSSQKNHTAGSIKKSPKNVLKSRSILL